ncbi:MAG: ATP-binding protein, partial [Oscillospiraceae bacterium]
MKKRNILLQTLILIIISFVLSTLISVNSLNTVIEGNNEEMSKVLTSNIYDSINNMLIEPINVAQTMSYDYFMINLLENEDFPGDMEDELISYLRTISGSMNYSSAFIVSEKSRTYYTQEGFNKIVSPETDTHDVWYSLFVDGGKKYDFDVDTDEVHNNAWTVFVNSRIENESGELLGVCGVSVVMTELQDMLCEYEKNYNIKINLVNQDGLVQIDTDSINIENVTLYIDTNTENGGMDYVYHQNKNGGYSVSKYVENLGWYLVVLSDCEADDQVYADMISMNIVIFVIILTVCVLMVSSSIISDKKRMVEYAREKEQYAKEQEELKAQAEEANKAKGNFLANMSHEIRTPINAVLGMNEMIMRESNEEQIIEYASSIQSAGRTLLSIINDILDFSKIESGKMEIVPVSYDVSSLVNDIVNMIKIRAEKKNLEFIYEIDENIPSVLFGDDVRIRQVITNILTNAIKYTEKGYVRFRISVAATGNESVRLDVSVTDTGIGIRKEDMENLFASFQRLDPERNRSIEGTGLGIPIVQRLLELMGSRLMVSSVYGSGSTFSFELEQRVINAEPIGDFEQRFRALALEHTAETAVKVAPDARVLVVDDNETNLLVAKNLLKRTKVQLDTALSGAKCIELLKLSRYDIVFLDHMMPEMDGIQALHKIKED